MNKGYPIFEWSPDIPITDKDNETKSEENKISSTHEDEPDDDITGNWEDEEIIEEDAYEDYNPSDRENNPSNYIIKTQNQNDQEDVTIGNDVLEKVLEMRTWINQKR